MPKITFLIADDHSMIRQGLVFIIEDLDIDYEIIQTSSISGILETIKNKPIDIAIIDVHFPDGNSLNILQEIRKLNSEIKILIFTGVDENAHALKFIKAGANGFLGKLSEEEDIQQAIQKIINTGEYISPITQAAILNSIQNPSLFNPLASLTEREMQIAKLYAKGLGNLEIANQLDIKQNTVSTQKKRIFEKLKIENIVELIELMNQDL